jgi:putative polymerase
VTYEPAAPDVGFKTALLSRDRVDLLITEIMGVTLLFNAFLAVIDAHVMVVTSSVVIAGEVLIFSCSVCLLVLTLHPDDRPWLALMSSLIGIGLLISLFREEFAAKNIRDVLSIPVFIMLGLRYSQSPSTLLRKLHVVVVGFAILEAALPDLFASIFDVKSYYINSRNLSTDDFWNADSSLFISATRPGERFFSFVDFHRMSSVFLEPVSLGNYVCVIVILLVTYWGSLSRWNRVWLISSTAFLLVACDGRFASVTSLLIILCMPLASKLPSRASVLYLPIIVALAAVATFALAPDPAQDNFSGRLAKTVWLLHSLDISDVLGMADSIRIGQHLDSGLTYMIVTQTIFGAGLVWLFTTLAPNDHVPYLETRLRMRRAIHATALFIALNLLVSYSLFSIKSASLLWFLYGAAIRPAPDEIRSN